MDEFRTIAKLWPNGPEVDLGSDSNLINGGTPSFTRTAAEYVTSPDGATTYRFLFWNTGRHVTTKRRVRWNFSVLGWGTWTATRWYGTPSPDGGPPRVHADPFSIGGDNQLGTATPIDGGASTYAAGAYPWNGNDREIDTAPGAAHVVAVSPLSNYDFAGWVQLVWGGDPSGEFVETDVGTTGSFGDNSYYDVANVLTGAFDCAQGHSADLLALYGVHHDAMVTIPPWLRDIFRRRRGPFEIPHKGDPSPIDLIRLGVLESLLERTSPATAGGATDYQRLIEAAPTMTRDQLTEALMSVKNSLGLGETARVALESALKRGGR